MNCPSFVDNNFAMACSTLKRHVLPIVAILLPDSAISKLAVARTKHGMMRVLVGPACVRKAFRNKI